jgi:hypothetical protein
VAGTDVNRLSVSVVLVAICTMRGNVWEREDVALSETLFFLTSSKGSVLLGLH